MTCFCFVLLEMIFDFANLDYFHLTALAWDKYRNPADFYFNIALLFLPASFPCSSHLKSKPPSWTKSFQQLQGKGEMQFLKFPQHSSFWFFFFIFLFIYTCPSFLLFSLRVSSTWQFHELPCRNSENSTILNEEVTVMSCIWLYDRAFSIF